MSRSRPLVVAVLVAMVVAALGGSMTDTGTWYQDLRKPPWTPPDWLFPPAWTLIYALAVFSAVAGWRATRENAERSWLLSLFFFNALLNVLWSAIFFTLRRPDWALAEVATLWLSILALIVFLVPRSRLAGALLVPYLLWVTFAAVLNARVVQLNAPFGDTSSAVAAPMAVAGFEALWPTVTPGFIDAILAGVLLEFLIVGAWMVRASETRLLAPFLLYLASGACLLAAVRIALPAPGSQRVALPMLGGLIAHVASLWTIHRTGVRACPVPPGNESD